MRRYFILLLLLAAVLPGRAQAYKQQLLNTASAEAAELLYAIEADSIMQDKLVIGVQAGFRHMLKMAERDERRRTVFTRDSYLYRELVRECTGFAREVGQMMDNARRHPEYMATCIKGGTELVNQAYSVVKHAVVVGMGSNVPYPWKVDLEKLLRGEDNTPDYRNDSERSVKDDDHDNMLLPDERYRIVNNAVAQLKGMRTAVAAVNSKLTFDIPLREKLKAALPLADVVDGARRDGFNQAAQIIRGYPLP